MREIKFKVWDKELKRIFDWDTILRGDASIVIMNHPRYVWMQYTGLKDKNSVEIYEGDLIQDTDSHEIGQVYWDDDNLCWQSLFCDNDSWGFVSVRGKDNHCEVIGNIYENPELIEVKEAIGNK